MTTLTKAKLVERLNDEIGLNKREARAVVELFFDEIMTALSEQTPVKISGFGNFAVRKKGQRPGRNPKTGQEIAISSRNVVVFRSGTKLRDLVADAVVIDPQDSRHDDNS